MQPATLVFPADNHGYKTRHYLKSSMELVS